MPRHATPQTTHVHHQSCSLSHPHGADLTVFELHPPPQPLVIIHAFDVVR